MSKKALILVDIQNDYFKGGRWPVENMQDVSVNAARLLEQFRSNGDMVIHIHHEIPSDEAPFFRPGSTGAEIHSSVAVNEGEKSILKHRPNSFHDTTLRSELEKNNITDVVICGAMTNLCIDATTRAAVDFGYVVTVVEDACGAKEQVFNGQEVPARQVHAAFMAPLAMTYARVISTSEYLEG